MSTIEDCKTVIDNLDGSVWISLSLSECVGVCVRVPKLEKPAILKFERDGWLLSLFISLYAVIRFLGLCTSVGSYIFRASPKLITWTTQVYGGRTLRVNFADKPKPKEPLYPETEHKLFVGNLCWSVTSESLTKVFQEYGNVVGARVLYDGETGKSRGYGFVCFPTRSEMEAALQSLDGVVYSISPSLYRTTYINSIHHLSLLVFWIIFLVFDLGSRKITDRVQIHTSSSG